MEWYEIILIPVIIIVGAYLHGKIRGQNRYNNYNDSWKNRYKK